MSNATPATDRTRGPCQHPGCTWGRHPGSFAYCGRHMDIDTDAPVDSQDAAARVIAGFLWTYTLPGHEAQTERAIARITGPDAGRRPARKDTTMTNELHRGTRVETSGQGRTARWPYGVGTVTRVWRRGGVVRSVEVRWDGTHFGDEMDAAEVRPVGTPR